MGKSGKKSVVAVAPAAVSVPEGKSAKKGVKTGPCVPELSGATFLVVSFHYPANTALAVSAVLQPCQLLKPIRLTNRSDK